MPARIPLPKLTPGQYIYAFTQFLKGHSQNHVVAAVVLSYPGFFDTRSDRANSVQYFAGECRLSGNGTLQITSAETFINSVPEDNFQADARPASVTISGANGSAVAAPGDDVSIEVNVYPPSQYHSLTSELKLLDLRATGNASKDTLPPNGLLYGRTKALGAIVAVALSACIPKLHHNGAQSESSLLSRR